MDIRKATDQQLHYIAKDESARLIYRYEAARELQRRKEEKKQESRGA
ncbi:hypothetical protein [Halalkalibacterium halodurans]|nr:hypothetical protein [Halalkalibacterium halodurans]